MPDARDAEIPAQGAVTGTAWHALPAEAALQSLASGSSGLTAGEAWGLRESLRAARAEVARLTAGEVSP